jgi:hypothetical protein
LREAVSDLLRGETSAGKLRIRSQVAALGRQFLKHLEQFCRMRARPDGQPAAQSHARPEPSRNPPMAPEPTRQRTTVTPVQASDATPPALHVLARAGKAAQLQQRGFQNRRTRRALRFKQPAGEAKAPAIQPAPRTGLP